MTRASKIEKMTPGQKAAHTRKYRDASKKVGLRIDDKNRLVGELWLPKVDLTSDEFQFGVRTVAIECDRFEYELTGADRE